MSIEVVAIGSFHVETGVLRVTDPCYDLETQCAGNIDNAKPGTWTASIERGDTSWEVRCWSLTVHHVDTPDNSEWWKCDFEVGVDSGQAGIFDLGRYPKSRASEGSFYDRVCDLTLSEKMAGCIEFGAVSSSGFGDGGYDAYVRRDASGKAVGVRIVFIEESEDAEDEE